MFEDSGGGPMIKPDIDALGVQERILLFCLASGTDWKQAGVTFKTVVDMVWGPRLRPNVRNRANFKPNCLVTMTPRGAYSLTNAGRAALRALLGDV
jgi:hypothetical protein